MNLQPKKAIVLISGGIDSTVTLAVAQAQGFTCYALSFDYGQRNRVELAAARQVAQHFQVAEHQIVELNLQMLNTSALVNSALEMPQQLSGKITASYVPARNTIFLSIALGWAEVLGAQDIFYGANSVDHAGFPDCRPEYFTAFEKLADLATEAGVNGAHYTIHAPLVHLQKAQIIKLGREHGVDFAMTFSCYDPNAQGSACGKCETCQWRARGFAEARLVDPLQYKTVP